MNWRFLGLLAGLVVGVFSALTLGADQRWVSATVGFLAFSGLFYRLVSTWPETNVLVHAVTLTLCVILLLGAIAQAEIATRGDVTPTSVGLPILGTRVACLVIALMWPRWMNRKFSPFRQYP